MSLSLTQQRPRHRSISLLLLEKELTMLASLKNFKRSLVALILPVVISIASFSTASLQAEEDQVLRHAVFFKFKETSSEADVQRIVDAFAALPNKIDSIIDFEWGERSSAEKISGGFTHCFLLTFNDEAGREKYLPHPDHKAFGTLLKPHLADVFVIDFWGKKAEKAASRALRHAVFLSFNKDAKQTDVDQALKLFAGLPDEIKTIKGFEWGTNRMWRAANVDLTFCRVSQRWANLRFHTSVQDASGGRQMGTGTIVVTFVAFFETNQLQQATSRKNATLPSIASDSKLQ
jgi:hypothetical protein